MVVDAGREFQDDAPRGPSEDSLARVVSLANRLVDLDSEIEEQEANLKKLREARRLVAEGELPAALDSCGDRGVPSLTLGGGYKVVVSTKYQCGQLDDVPDDPKKGDRKPLSARLEALRWLEDNGHGDLAKRTIVITLGKGSAWAEEAIRKHFQSLRLNSAQLLGSNVVPWNTLSAFVKNLEGELEAEGSPDAVPLDLLGIRKIRVAEVKQLKSKDDLT